MRTRVYRVRDTEATVILHPGEDAFSSSITDADNDDDHAVRDVVGPIGEAIGSILNSFADAIGGDVISDSEIKLSIYLEAEGEDIFQRLQVWETSPTGAASDTYHSSVSASDGDVLSGQEIINHKVLEILKRMEFAGGNIYVQRAIAASQAPTLEQLAGEIQIAEDYGRYLANKAIIDTLIAFDPESAFAAGWLITLLRAEEMGIALKPADFAGGLAGFLKSYDAYGVWFGDEPISIDGSNSSAAWATTRSMAVWGATPMSTPRATATT